MSRGEFTGQKWAECRCGKIIDVFVRDETQQLVDMRLKLASMELCQSCSMDLHRLLEAVPDGWAKIGGRWQHIELVVDQWGRTDAEGNPAPASYVKPPVYRIGQEGMRSDG